MQILSKYDLFIFDWDHTLTTSTVVITLLYLITRRRKRARAREYEKGNIPKSDLRNIKVDVEVSQLYSFLDDIYSLLFRPRLKKDAMLLLQYLKENNKKIAVFSDSKTYRLMKEIRELGAFKYVDFALSAESICCYKPNPTGVLLLLDRLKADKKRSVYIGDMATDVLTAKLSGIDSCGVSDGIDSYTALKQAKPTYEFETLSAFLDAVKK
jgi:FMN phosphatase YigB (HAD superfamily)